MANVQTTDGVARVLPDATPPDSRQRIQANPDDFGAQIGAAKQRGGQVLSRIGEQAFDAGEHFGRVQVDDQATKWMTDANVHLDEFRKLEGQARLDARSRMEKAIEAASKKYRAELKLPFQQEAYDKQTRNFQQGYLGAQISSLSHQADRSYKVDVAKRKLETSLNMAAVGVNDPIAVAAGRHSAREAQVNLLEAEGNDHVSELYDAAIAEADNKWAKTVVQSIGATSPKAAQEFATAHKAELGVDYAAIFEHMQGRADQQEGFAAVDSAQASVAAEMANPPERKSTGIRQAIHEQENGPASNPTQIQPTTWDQWKTQGLVKEGDNFGDPASMQRVSDRAMEKYEQDYGGDPERVAVAWFSGPGNVAPAGSPTPYLNDLHDENKKSVSSYVADIRGKVGGQRSQIQELKASGYEKILDDTRGNPRARQVALTEWDRRIRASETASMANEAARKLQTDGAIRSYGDFVREGGQGQPWQKDGRLTEAQVRDMDDYQAKKVKQRLTGGDGDYGAGFDGVASRIRSTGDDRILYAEQMLPMVRTGELTVDGYDQAEKLLERFRKPGLEGEKNQEQAFFDAAKKAVTLEFTYGDKVLPVKPERLETWNKATTVLYAAIADGKKNGVPVNELFNRESPKSVWKVLGEPGGMFLPSRQAAQNASLTAALSQDAKVQTEAPKPFSLKDVKTQAEALEAWRTHPEIPPAEFQQLWDDKGWGVRVKPAAPQVPSGAQP